MKRALNAFAALYICFAICLAHSALAPNKELAPSDPPQGSIVGTLERTLLNSEQVDRPIEGRDVYQIVVVSAKWCGPCQRFKREQLPTLLKSGCKVQVLDFDTDTIPQGVRAVPTIIVMYKGGERKRFTGYQTAAKILMVVDKHRGVYDKGHKIW